MPRPGSEVFSWLQGERMGWAHCQQRLSFKKYSFVHSCLIMILRDKSLKHSLSHTKKSILRDLRKKDPEFSTATTSANYSYGMTLPGDWRSSRQLDPTLTDPFPPCPTTQWLMLELCRFRSTAVPDLWATDRHSLLCDHHEGRWGILHQDLRVPMGTGCTAQLQGRGSAPSSCEF